MLLISATNHCHSVNPVLCWSSAPPIYTHTQHTHKTKGVREDDESRESRESRESKKREDREDREERSVKRIEREDHETIPGEIVAVIAATIAAKMGREEKRVRILSIKNVPDKSWRRSYYTQRNHD